MVPVMIIGENVSQVRNMINDLMENTRQRVKNETRVIIDTNLAYAVGNITDQIRWANVPWEKIGQYLGLPPLPLTWSRCQGADLNLKEMIGFEFDDTQESDTCVGLIETTGAIMSVLGTFVPLNLYAQQYICSYVWSVRSFGPK